MEVAVYVSLEGATASVCESRFCWISQGIWHFFNYKTGGVWLKIFIVWLVKWFCIKLILWKLVHTRLWKEPPPVFDRVAFAEFDWICDISLNIKTEEWNLNILLVSYWNDLVLDSGETYFFRKFVHTCLWKEPPQVFQRVAFAEFDWKCDIF